MKPPARPQPASIRNYRDLVDLPISSAEPLMMHIDLNSCFSTIEQQANPLIRNKPVAVAAYTRDTGIVLAASYDAKALGIKLGTSVREARQIYPGVIILMPDPPKYREAHRRFRDILTDYTDNVVAKSIDEFVLDFHGSPAVRDGRSMADIGAEIKQRIKQEIGEYVTVNVGIGSNRFLAKLAAGLHKPDGLDIITAENILDIYQQIELMALPGINHRFKARLQAAGIGTPLEMYQASGTYLKNFVFFSKLGHQWHQRLRGYEVDAVEFDRKTIGHQYALEERTTDREALKRLLMKLCEKTGRRLRRHGFVAYGIDLHLRYSRDGPGFDGQNNEASHAVSESPGSADSVSEGGYRYNKGFGSAIYTNRYSHWHESHKTPQPLYATQEIYRAAEALLAKVRFQDKVSLMSVTVFNLTACDPEQLGLFDDSDGRLKHKALAQAADHANDRYGEFSVVPAIMADMSKTILDRIAFGNVQDL